MENLLQDVENKLTFDQYAVSEHWSGEVDENGKPVLSTTVDTVQGVTYELEFNLAANLSADVESVTVEVVFEDRRPPARRNDRPGMNGRAKNQ